METQKDSHSEVFEQESLVSYRGTGGLHGNMVWETPTFPLRVFCSGSLPTPQCYQRSLNFLG